MSLEFGWDPTKARSNLRKHRVTFEEATTVFGDPLSLTIADMTPALRGDDRFVTIGQSAFRRLLVVVHSDIDDSIRIISARESSRFERATYEQGRET